MEENYFIKNPIKLVIFDPIKLVDRKTFVFLGDVPGEVRDACMGTPSAEADKTLRAFYGRDFKAKLGRNTITGGDLDDDIAMLLSENVATPTESSLDVAFESGITYVSDVHLFPEDNIMEFMDKIYLTTNIPLYRQHLFYLRGDRSVQSYNVIKDDSMYYFDIYNLTVYKNNIHGIPIDQYMYNNRNSIKIESKETFTLLYSEALTNNQLFYVVDLHQFTYNIQSQLREIVTDTYQFDLIYYGFVLKFWPQLTRDCFHDYIMNEGDMQYKYPDLAKNRAITESVYSKERDIIVQNYRVIQRAILLANGNATIAITQATAVMRQRNTIINTRNLFDKLHASRCIPEIHCYYEINNKKYLFRKRHVKIGTAIQFPSGNKMKNGVTVAISLRKSDQANYHNKDYVSTYDNEQSRYMFLNILNNGTYYVRVVWNEEEEFTFKETEGLIRRFTEPIIREINKMGRYVFVAGSSLPIASSSTMTLENLNISIFWKRVIPESAFKLIKTFLEAYVQAHITAPRNVLQFDKFEFMFRKGMYEFDTSLIKKVVSASNDITLNNYYSYLSNSTIKQKWDQIYDGRITRIYHRSTDVKFEILDVQSEEFNFFNCYILCFIYNITNDEKFLESIDHRSTNVKRLRKLREEDPELYNLKKYNSSVVYSKLCQSQRQPLVVTNDEYAALGERDRAKLVKYHNFTYNKPTYYECPSEEYPHLSFIVGVHPKNYCLPCCNKKRKNELADNKRAKINEICFEKHVYMEKDDPDILSRHIMNYGKDIDLNRISKLPPTIKNLVHPLLPSNKVGYYLFGVAQNVPGASNVGTVFAIAEALGEKIEVIIKRLIAKISETRKIPLFYTLLNGTLPDYFATIGDLTSTLADLFLHKKLFARTLKLFAQWNELFIELFYLLFDVSVLTFIDESGGNIDLFVPNNIINNIMYVEEMKIEDDQKYIIVIKSKNNVYPMFAIDVDEYNRSREVANTYFSRHDLLAKSLFEVIVHGNQNRENIDKQINLAMIERFVAQSKNYTIKLKFINQRNLCYLLLLERRGVLIYMPIDYSVHSANGVPISYDAFVRADYDLPYSAFATCAGEINAFIGTNYVLRGQAGNDLYSYKMIDINRLIMHGGSIIGGIDHFYYYFSDYSGPDLPKLELMYSYDEINRLILQKAPPVADPRATILGRALYENFLYQLFVIEFINYLNSERNTAMRDAIKKLIEEANFDYSTDSEKLCDEILAEYPHDITIFRSRLNQVNQKILDKENFYKFIDNEIYDFDRVTLNELRNSSRKDMITKIKKIADEFSIERDLDTRGIKFPNIYVPCAEFSDTGYCYKNKLVVQGRSELINLLTSDFADDIKARYLLNNIWADTTINTFDFEKYPMEITTIYKLEKKL